MNEPARFSRPYKRFVCLARHMIPSTEQRNQIFVQQEHCHAEDKSESTLSAPRHARGKAPTEALISGLLWCRQAGCRGAKCTDSSLCPDDSVVVKLPTDRIEATVKAGLDTAVGVLSAERSHDGRFTSGARVW